MDKVDEKIKWNIVKRLRAVADEIAKDDVYFLSYEENTPADYVVHGSKTSIKYTGEFIATVKFTRIEGVG